MCVCVCVYVCVCVCVGGGGILQLPHNTLCILGFAQIHCELPQISLTTQSWIGRTVKE